VGLPSDFAAGFRSGSPGGGWWELADREAAGERVGVRISGWWGWDGRWLRRGWGAGADGFRGILGERGKESRFEAVAEEVVESWWNESVTEP
jgi:hypothetical protein